MSYYKKFTHEKCEFFPCHKGIEKEDFNCLFCYCPLYLLGEECGGDFVMRGDLKDCSGCRKPHDKNSYEFIQSKMPLIFGRKR